MMPHGGRRAGAGRKSNAEIKTVRSIVDAAVIEEQWRQLIRRLFQHALKGNLRAVQLLLSYRFGDPYAPPAEKDLTPISIITVHESPHPRLGNTGGENTAP